MAALVSQTKLFELRKRCKFGGDGRGTKYRYVTPCHLKEQRVHMAAADELRARCQLFRSRIGCCSASGSASEVMFCVNVLQDVVIEGIQCFVCRPEGPLHVSLAANVTEEGAHTASTVSDHQCSAAAAPHTMAALRLAKRPFPVRKSEDNDIRVRGCRLIRSRRS